MSKFDWFTRSLLQLTCVLALGTMAHAHDTYNFTFPFPSLRPPIHLRPNWHKVPGTATDISVGSNGSVYVIGTDRANGGYGIHHFDGSNWHRISNGGGVRIATSPNGEPWVVNDRQEIYYLQFGQWRKMPGHATEVAVGPDGRPWIISTQPFNGGGLICRLNNNGGWESMNGGAVKLAIDANGSAWAVNSRNEIYQQTQGGWARTSGTAIDVGTSANGSVFVVGTDPYAGGHMVYQRVGNNWKPLNRGGFSLSGGARDHVWIVNSQSEIWVRRSPTLRIPSID